MSNNKENKGKNRAKLISMGNNIGNGMISNENNKSVGSKDGQMTPPPAVVHNPPGSFVMNQQQLLAMSSVLRTRAQLTAALGQQFDGQRDLYEVLGYKKLLNFQDYLARYTRDNIAKRIVDAFPEATWANKPILVGIKDGNNARNLKEFNDKWNRICKQINLITKMNRADKLAGIGNYGILLIGVNDGRSLDQPIGKVRKTTSGKDILYAQPYSQANADILEIEKDTANERFGKPKFYNLKMGDLGIGLPIPLDVRTQKVHFSRIIHIADGLLENEIYGTPRLEVVYNLFDDLAKVNGGSAEFFWRIADRGIHFDIDKDASYTPADENALEDHIEDYMHGLKRTLHTRGVSSKVLGSESADPRGPFSSIISLISGATGYPQRMLLGSERGQLASSQDRASLNERVAERQDNFAEPNILRPVIDLFITVEALPETEYDVEWPIPIPQSQEEKSIITHRAASSIKTISQQQAGQVVVTPDEFRQEYLGLPPLPKEIKDENDEIKEAELENKKSPPELSIVPGGKDGDKENNGVGKGQKEKSEEPVKEKKTASQ